ncbi:hypothetical protein BC941DRAFT_412612 [Chlamydoabsidia padenii]|nr:hypothetical protein BC941DRAFT_412612 [Chlamydoabsidia padenii]
MLRVYSILHLEPLWLKRSYTETCIVDEPNLVHVEPVQVETRDIQEQEQEEEALEPGYLEIVEETTIQQQEEQIEPHQDPTEVVVLVEEEEGDQQQQHEEEEELSSSSSSLSTSDQNLTFTQLAHDEIHEEKEPITSSPPLTCDLTSIMEESHQEVNDASHISSNGSIQANTPPTPTSTTSTSPPRRRVRRDSKFNERRKSMTNKLKRAFSSNSQRSNSVASN